VGCLELEYILIGRRLTMLGLALAPTSEPLRILCIGAHADDIEIGCGATLLTLIRARPDVQVTWFIACAEGEREAEARASAAELLVGAASVDIRIHHLRENYLPYSGEAKEAVSSLAGDVTPDLVFSTTRHDLHQDHRALAEIAWNTFRDHLILEYEIPKYDGDLGAPGVFVSIDEATVEHKLDLLERSFPSQQHRYWFTRDTFRAILRLRGIEARSPTGYAEAFYGRKLPIGFH
jgi:LmbE family N-acetylglucosaminyl deacetylase